MADTYAIVHVHDFDFLSTTVMLPLFVEWNENTGDRMTVVLLTFVNRIMERIHIQDLIIQIDERDAVNVL